MNYVDEIVNLLNKNLKYIKHEITKNTIYNYVVSNRKKVKCPTCGVETDKVHSKYKRSYQLVERIFES